MVGEGGSEGERGELIMLPFQEIQAGQRDGFRTLRLAVKNRSIWSTNKSKSKRSRK